MVVGLALVAAFAVGLVGPDPWDVLGLGSAERRQTFFFWSAGCCNCTDATSRGALLNRSLIINSDRGPEMRYYWAIMKLNPIVSNN